MPAAAWIVCNAALVLGSAVGAELGHSLGAMRNAMHGAGFGGEKMERSYTSYVELPVGEEALLAAGWTKSAECNAAIGYMWTQEGDAATSSKPLVLYTTEGGQMSGAGVHIYGALPESQMKWVTPSTADGANGYRVDVAFRTGSIICSGNRSSVNIGDALIVNPGSSNSKELSLTQAEAEASGWHRGACFNGMGFHEFFDTTTSGSEMSWKAENLFPVVVMYHEGEVNAMFFASWTIQQGFFSSNQWEPVALPNAAMCANTCDSDCTFQGTSFWSTMHVYFRDHNKVTCPSELHCTISGVSCCPTSDVVV